MEENGKKKLSVEPYKGVRDFYPEDQALMNYLFRAMRSVAERCGYVEYHSSVLEPAELYKAKNVESEEIINEQSYTFTDRGGREVTLRPEMTPTVARMVAARRRDFGFPLRLYSIPNVFRYERPQRGRLREHWQFNVDLFGSISAAADAEVILVAYSLMTSLGATEDDFVIRVGSRTFIDEVCRVEGLSEVQSKKFMTLLDRRAKMPAAEFDSALAELGVPKSSLEGEPPAEVVHMIADFNNAGINNIVWDPSVVRGFAYYTGIVFEVFDTHPENNRALFGGGRYENLTALFDESPPAGGIPGVGFGAGDVTLRDFLAVRNLIPPYAPPTQVYIAVTSPGLAATAQIFAGHYLRSNGINAAVDFGEKKLSDQIKAAVKHKIPYLLVLGEDELATGQFTVRDLASGDESIFTLEQLPQFFLSR
jgi:histidyl-tRNA synthetase